MMQLTPILLLLLLLIHPCASKKPFGKKSPSAPPTTPPRPSPILIIGSINSDTFLPIPRLPTPGENLVCHSDPIHNIPGGKGCNQAVAVSRLSKEKAIFVGRLGNDEAASHLFEVLQEEPNLVEDYCGFCREVPTGYGFVFQNPHGEVSAVVSGGANMHGWGDPSEKIQFLEELLRKKPRAVLLQREIPEWVNEQIIGEISTKLPECIIIQDVGGEDRVMSKDTLEKCHYLIPNETELRRLASSHSSTEQDPIQLAKILQKEGGAQNIIVTLGQKGCIYLSPTGKTIQKDAFHVSDVVDETGAGDCFRAAFCVALCEGDKTLEECLEFACAAGALAVQVQGAVPSMPTREQLEAFLAFQKNALNTRGGGSDKGLNTRGGGEEEFPFMFGSRLNSMKDRLDLCSFDVTTVEDYVRRQSQINGLDCVDFNYPQHFHSWTAKEAKACLDKYGLKAGAVCLRYPTETFQLGAMMHPDASIREEAIRLTKEAAETARILNCNEVVVWSAFDGYDYPFQISYDVAWQHLVQAFQECCDAFPQIKFSLEFKPTDEHTRFFCVPSTGAALLLVNEIDRENMGLTLDFGHCFMAGENPAQSIAMVGNKGKLFGVQMNDGYTRLAAEDGLMFGSVHPYLTLEAMYYLLKTGYKGHFYFDTFPQRTDPIKEAECNIKRVKYFWRAAKRLLDLNVGKEAMEKCSALVSLEMMDDALAWARDN